jgi:hypothetical protein
MCIHYLSHLPLLPSPQWIEWRKSALSIVYWSKCYSHL